MKVKVIALAAAVALAAGAARAQQEAPSRGANLYVGLSYGEARAPDACSGLANCDESDKAFGALAGYWLHPNVAAEIGYYNLGRASAPGGTYVRSNAWELVGVPTWRVRNPLSLYAKLGFYRGAQEGGGARLAQKELVTAFTYGVGAQLDFTKKFGVRGEWQKYPRFGGGPVLPRGDIDVLRAAALWRFQ